ncbi:CPLD29 [Auxenochlorella protothecoides x Auxenochlorella symbiontica]
MYHEERVRLALIWVALPVALAWLLSRTTASLLGNIPLAMLLVASAKLFTPARPSPEQASAPGQRRRVRPASSPAAVPPGEDPLPTLRSPPPPTDWREAVGSDVVAHAWHLLCGSIVQEFIYDVWYSAVTPDCEFPAKIRALLNDAFGKLAARSRQADLRAVLNDLSELLMEQIDLYRDTRESIQLAARCGLALKDMQPAARERAFRREMKAENNLHPAMHSPQGHYLMLRAVSRGIARLLLDPKDIPTRCPSFTVTSELLAAVVLRPLMMFCHPYHVNKGLYVLLSATQPGKKTASAPPRDGQTPVLKAALSAHSRGNWDFEQRLMSSVALEASAAHSAEGRERGPSAGAPRAAPSARPPRPGSPPRSPSAPDLLSGSPSRVGIPPTRPPTPGSGGGLEESRPASEPNASAAAPDGGAHLIAGAADSASVESGLAAQRARRGAALQAGPGSPFRGRLRARVVVADLNAAGGKDYVVYQVRVGDDVGEWTVARRYRNFEVLHRQLKQDPCYRLKLPPKRVFVHSQNVDFVEERRVALNAYLQTVLAHPVLQGKLGLGEMGGEVGWFGTQDVIEFCRPGSEVYEMSPYTRSMHQNSSESNPVRRSLSLTTPILNVKDMLSDVTKSAVQASTDAVLDSASVFKAGLKKGRALPIFPSSSSLTSRGASRGSSLSHAGWKAFDSSFDEAHGDHTAIQAADTALRRERGPRQASNGSMAPPCSPSTTLAGAPSPPRPPTPPPDDGLSVSAPLYELVDCVFQLATRGFFRRQVFAVARQVLSLVAGTTIDEYLTARLRSLRSEHTIGRAIAGIQAALWPGGVWYQATPQYRAAQGVGLGAGIGVLGAGGPGSRARPPAARADSFLTPNGPPPLDAEEVREAVAQLLLTCAPATLVGLVGKSAYTSGMEDVIEMMQSETLILQLGYGALEILAVHLMPELKPLFLSLKHGGLGRPDADEDGPDM